MVVHFWINASSIVLMYIYPKIYKIAQAYYKMYKEYGNEALAAALESTFGDMSMPAEEWLKQMMGTAGNLTLTVPQVLVMYGPSALIMGILAFLVYKKLATRNGNWYRICAGFKLQPKVRKTETEPEVIQTEAEPKQRMITVPLVIGMLIGVAFMVFYEIMLYRAGI